MSYYLHEGASRACFIQFNFFLGFLQVGLLDEYRIVQSWAGPRFEKEQGVVDLGRFYCW